MLGAQQIGVALIHTFIPLRGKRPVPVLGTFSVGTVSTQACP